jgi:hypothetical protein
MFCPQCKAEYRQGIAECADCQVPLVASLPEGQEILVDTVSAGTLIPLWEGQDLALHTSLLQELDAASIPYFNKPMGVFPGARRGDAFPIQPMAPTWEVWVGPDDEFASFLQNALRENEILLRVECVDGESRVFVRPCDAPRAKEILRELSEGSPPR